MSKSAMSTVVSILGAALFPALAACAPTTAGQPMTAQERLNACPLSHLSGVSAAVTDTPDGATVLFTAPPAQQDQLAASVQAMADANRKQGSPFAACPCAVPETAVGLALMQAQAMPAGGCVSCPPPPTSMPPVDAKVMTTPAGTELRLKMESEASPATGELSNQPYTLSQIRTAAREHVAYLNAACLGAAHHR
jgi:hypothetical protein